MNKPAEITAEVITEIQVDKVNESENQSFRSIMFDAFETAEKMGIVVTNTKEIPAEDLDLNDDLRSKLQSCVETIKHFEFGGIRFSRKQSKSVFAAAKDTNGHKQTTTHFSQVEFKREIIIKQPTEQ